MPAWLGHWVDLWTSLYSNSAVLRTGVGFAHVGGLLVGGGMAIAADRATLAAWSQNAEVRMAHVRGLRGTHKIVAAGLIAVLASGLLLLGADLETYLYSTVFWVKMVMVGLLLANGVLLVETGRHAQAGDDRAWPRLRYGAMASIVLWFVTTLLGAALPNV
jgi:hypothetical protein